MSVATKITAPTPWKPVLRNRQNLTTIAVLGVVYAAGISFAHWKMDALAPLTAAGIIFAFYASVVSVIDLRTHRLPNVFTYPAAGVALLFAAGLGWAYGDLSLLLGGLLGGLVSYTMWWIAAFVTRGIGYGDLKFMVAAGILLGTVSWQAWLGGSLVFPGLCILLLGPIANIGFSRGSKTPAGPMLAAGQVLAIAFAPALATFTY